MGEEEDIAGQRNSLREVREDWEIHHFFLAVGSTWRGTKRCWNGCKRAGTQPSRPDVFAASFFFSFLIIVLTTPRAWLLFNHSWM